MGTPDAVVEVPSGYKDGAECYVMSLDHDEFLGLWTVGQVEHDACHPQLGLAIAPMSARAALARVPPP
ncbi:MAG: hypothetical protein H0V07_05985 [Propionibacteriales bacterium]|nr:hypothetical protein [Propionibacteriales bacterium]